MDEIDWKSSSYGNVPPGSFVGGKDCNGCLYVARAMHKGCLIPGKLNPQYKKCYVPWNGLEHEKHEYQVLCDGNFKWEDCSGNRIPRNAVPGGYNSNSEILYIGRVEHQGTTTVGKVHPSHGKCYISFGGKEAGYSHFKILVKA